MKVLYEAIITESGGCCEACFPDLDIVTQGEDMADAAFMAQDLLENYVAAMLQLGRELPAPTFGNDCGDGYRIGIVAVCDEATPQAESMSVSEAADILDVTPSRIRAMVKSGILKARKVGRILEVDAQDVMERFNEPVHAGRPRAMEA